MIVNLRNGGTLHCIRDATRQVEAAEEFVPIGVSLKKSVTIRDTALQHDRTTVADVRLLFDSVIADYHVMAEHLRAKAKIVHSPLLESVLVKISNVNTMTAAEARSVKCFETAIDSENDADGDVGDQASAKKKRCCDYVISILGDGKKYCVSVCVSVQYTPLAKLVPPI